MSLSRIPYLLRPILTVSRTPILPSSTVKRTMSSASPPHKRTKMDSDPAPAPAPATAVAEEPMIPVSEAPVNALFVPSTSTSASSGSSTIKPPAPKQGKKKNRRMKRYLPEPYSPAEVTYRDVRDFLGPAYIDEVLNKGDESEWLAPEGLELWSIIELTVGAFTVSGESLSLYQPTPSSPKWAIITPFAHPGDRIRAKIFKHDRFCSSADLVEILEYSEEFRGGEGDRRLFPENGCKYFGECGGCQLQPVPYPLQLLHKRKTVQLAYSRFSALSPSFIPEIQPTIGSPKQWGYRTKITPHFDAPPKAARAARDAKAAEQAAEEEGMNGENEKEKEEVGWECRIGFERKGRPGVLDIEECPIATPVINTAMIDERKRVKETIWSFKRGATLLLRDSLPPPSPVPTQESPFDPSSSDLPADQHVTITNHRLPVYERVGPYLFQFAAGSFFQNNNSILVPLVEYVKEAIFPGAAGPITATSESSEAGPTGPVPTHLVDTYCGSGLFGITLSSSFQRVAGVEISQDSITAAKRNAEMNGLGEKTEWLCGKAEDIFGGLAEKGFEGGKSCVVCDPPRKGCDAPFLTQLLEFQPLTIVYVSCNVHTQARDVGWFLTESWKEERVGQKGGKYVLESLRGFDLFPQTAHVESVAVLRWTPSA